MRGFVFGTVVALLLLVGAVSSSAAQDGPSISIYSPGVGGGAIYGNHLLVQVKVSGFRLDGRAINKPSEAGVGYWVMYVDGAYAGSAASEMIMAPNAALERLAAGRHAVRVELVDTLGRALVPPVFAETAVDLGQEMIYQAGRNGTPAIRA